MHINAQQSPSNCNTQPWVVHIVSGKKLRQLSQALHDANTTGNFNLNFTFD
ncbi:nitroreductase family protein [Chryseobacterium kimseyorum]|uniref:nitroreductase family protein n=1 Tax=Chryseobacterium kimseyorum TaxID=2984028 RepID=UPI00387366AE